MPRSPDSEPSDGDLLRRLADNDPTALRLLMDRYDRLVRFAIFRASRQRCRQDPIWLDSIASEVWTGLCRSRRAGKATEITNIHSFFIQVARRRCIDALRRSSGPASSEDPAELENKPEAIDKQEDTLTTLANLEDVSALRECMGSLPDADRALCGEIGPITAGKWREAANGLGMPESTLRSRWSRVLERLRTCLEKKGRNIRA